MPRLRVTLLIGRSLLMDGLATRLRAHPDLVRLSVVQVTGAAALERLRATDPRIVLFDAADELVHTHVPLRGLLAALPEVQVVQLDPRGEPAKIVSSRTRPTASTGDVLALIQELGAGAASGPAARENPKAATH